MKKHRNKPVTKKQLQRISKLNKSILKILPENHNLFSIYNNLQKQVEESVNKYEFFKVNPYKIVVSQLDTEDE